MQALIFPFLYCLLLGSAWSALFGKKFSDSLAPALMLHMIIVMLCGMVFHKLSVGIYGGIAFFATALGWRLAKGRPDAKKLARDLWDSGLFVFFVLYLFCFFSNYGKQFIWWDEFAHWGMFLKESLRLDKLYAESPFPFWHKDYVPAATLFEVIWCRLSGRFLEADAYRAIQMVMFAMMLPMFNSFAPQAWEGAEPAGIRQNLRWAFSGRGRQLASVFFVMLLPLLLSKAAPRFYHTIYVDLFLGVVFFYCTMLAWRDNESKGYQALVLALGFAILLLTKQNGIVLLPLVFMLYVAKLALFSARRTGVRHNTKLFAMACATAFASVLLWGSFNIFVDTHVSYCEIDRGLCASSDANIQSYSGFRGARLFESLKKPEHSSIERLGEFQNKFVRAIFYERPILNLPHGAFISVAIIISVFVFALAQTRLRVEQRRKIRLAGYFIAASALAYIVQMYLLYVVAFPLNDYVVLASYERYMGTFILSVTLFAVCLYYDSVAWEKHIAASYVAPVLLLGYLLFSQPAAFRQVLPGMAGNYHSFISVWGRFAACRLAAAVPENAKTYAIFRSGGLEDFRPGFSFFSHPRTVSVSSIGPDIELGSWTVASDNLPPEQLYDRLKNFDYLYFIALDDSFVNKYSAIFKSPELLKDDAVYKIAAAENGVIVLDSVDASAACEQELDTAQLTEAITGGGGAPFVRLLLDKGADVNAANKDGSTAISHTAAQGNSEALALLLDKGADVNATDKDGTTLLMDAARHGQAEIAKLLLEHGADANKANKNGDTALQMAEKQNHPEIADMLRAAGQLESHN